MSSLEWNLFAAKFYAFKQMADKCGFYSSELARMEDSIKVMCPYEESTDLHKRVIDGYSIHQKKLDMADWAFAKTPVYDDNDNLIHA